MSTISSQESPNGIKNINNFRLQKFSNNKIVSSNSKKEKISNNIRNNENKNKIDADRDTINNIDNNNENILFIYEKIVKINDSNHKNNFNQLGF